MTESGDAYRDYYREVELHWSWRREKQIIVSPLEFESIEAWHEAEVPLEVVLRAIDLFIEKKRRSKRRRGFLLSQVHDTVLAVYREYTALRVGQGGEGEELLADKLKRLAAKVKKLAKAHPAMAEFAADLAARVISLKTEEMIGYEDAESRLSELDRELVAAFTNQLSAESLANIREEVESLLTEEEDPAFFAKLIDDGIRAHFGLARLTVLG